MRARFRTEVVAALSLSFLFMFLLGASRVVPTQSGSSGTWDTITSGTLTDAGILYVDSGTALVPSGTGTIGATNMYPDAVAELALISSNSPSADAVLLYNSGTQGFKWAAVTISDAGVMTLGTAGSSIDLTPSATAGGCVTLKEASDNGSEYGTICVNDAITTTFDCVLTVSGLSCS